MNERLGQETLIAAVEQVRPHAWELTAMGYVAGPESLSDWVDRVPVGDQAQAYLEQVRPYYERAGNVLYGEYN